MGKWLAKIIFKIFGWSLDDHLKGSFNRCVMIAAPHTSNWDMIFARSAFYLMDIPVRFTVKKEWTRFPFGLFMNPLGAIAIDRSPKRPGEEKASMTDAMVDLFEHNKELVVLVAAEGTRSLRTKWRTGFYHIALKANVPIALGYLDYKNKIAGIGKVINPTGDMQKDMKEIMIFYKDIPAKYPDKYSIDQDYV